MNKSILISIRPEHAVKILNGEKTLELRKSVPKDFVGWAYIYVTKGKKLLINKDFVNEFYVLLDVRNQKDYIDNALHSEVLNGKVVARFWFDEYTLLLSNYPKRHDYYDYFDANLRFTRDMLWRRLNLTKHDLSDYGKGKMLYAWHIKRLEIFNKPKDLWDFHTRHDMLFLGRAMARKVFQFESVYKAPQSWQYIWLREYKMSQV